ncbi:class GN sortase [uncultured Alcanivorax sp.]|uniref:class GN sortase n=1 Tax=uncultured Alcanivorax sp. TaxID=191215 RepID=UPI0026153EFD|nr:class GN sortase [uncultured Alcanivorax sp.]
MARYERGLLVLSLVALLGLAGWASWLDGKAWLAQHLIAHAWQTTLDQGAPQRPWPWADTWPVARLTTPAGKNLYVLESTSGEALAFGPGRLAGGIGSDQALTLAGHRDTHFAFLETLNTGEALTVQFTDGSRHQFQVAAQQVINSQKQPLHIPLDDQQLLLITCYPFDAITPGGPLRYVVAAHTYPDETQRDGATNQGHSKG